MMYWLRFTPPFRLEAGMGKEHCIQFFYNLNGDFPSYDTVGTGRKVRPVLLSTADGQYGVFRFLQ
jgi:hypothetical protein